MGDLASNLRSSMVLSLTRTKNSWRPSPRELALTNKELVRADGVVTSLGGPRTPRVLRPRGLMGLLPLDHVLGKSAMKLFGVDYPSIPNLKRKRLNIVYLLRASLLVFSVGVSARLFVLCTISPRAVRSRPRSVLRARFLFTATTHTLGARLFLCALCSDEKCL